MPSRSQSEIVRFLLVEQRQLLREALRALLEREQNFKVVAEAASCQDAGETLRRDKPQIVLMSLQAAQDECFTTFMSSASTLKVIILAEAGQPDDLRQVIVAGAKALLSTRQPAATLLTAIERARAGEVWIEPELMTQILSTASPQDSQEQNSEKAKIDSLTEREIEVIQLLAEGLKNHEIGERLFLSEGSVRHYLNRVFTKLDITDRSKLLIYAFRHGIAKPY